MWKTIPNWPNYEVSTLGNVRSIARGALLKPMRTGRVGKSAARSKVRLCSAPRVDFDVAHLVLTLFVGPRPDGFVAMHINDNPHDNRLSNLRWASIRENTHDSIRKGRGGVQRVSATSAQAIQEMRSAGFRGNDVALLYGISPQRVCDIYKDRTVFKTKGAT